MTETWDDPNQCWEATNQQYYKLNFRKTTTIEGVRSTDDISVCGSGTNLAITANLNKAEHVVDVDYNNRGGGGGVTDGGQSPPTPTIGKTLLNTSPNLLPITTATDTFNNLKNLVKIDKGSNPGSSSGGYSGNVSGGYRPKGVGGYKASGGAPIYGESRNIPGRSGSAGVSGHFSTVYNKNSVKIRQHDSDVSPRPRRPYQGDSSSSRYYSKNSDLLGQSGQSAGAGSLGSGRSLTGEPAGRSSISSSTGGAEGRRPYQTGNNGGQNLSDGSNQSRGLNSSSGGNYRSQQQNSRYENGNGQQQRQYGNLSSSSNYNTKQQSYAPRGSNEHNVNTRKPQRDDFTNYRDYDDSPRQRYNNNNNNSNSLERSNGGRYKSSEGGNTHSLSGLRQGGGGNDSFDYNSSDRSYNNRSGNAGVNTPTAQSAINNASTSSRGISPNSGALNFQQQQQQQPPSSSTPPPPPSAGRWVPPSLRPQHGLTQSEKNDAVFRKVRGILNKLTPEKFQELSDDLLKLDLNSIVILNGVILLIFDKALDEPKYSSMYAQLCKRLSEEAPSFEEDSNNSCTFLRLLIAVCRDKFNNRLKKDGAETDNNNQFNKVHKPQSQQTNTDNDTDDEERRHLAKQRMLGNVKFIGELNKLNMLSKNVLHQCIQELLDKKKKRSASPQEMCEDMECLSQLLKTCGKNLDSEQGKELMNQYFETLERRSKSTEYPPRIRFMLKDVIELRENNWVPRKVVNTEGPVPIKQIRTDDDAMIRTPFANRNREMRNNDRDGDSWMNRFHLNLQPGFNDVFGSLSVTGSSQIMSPFAANSNSNRTYNNQRNNQSNNYSNRYNKINQNGSNHIRDDMRNNQHANSNRDQSSSQFNNQMLNSKELAPRFKRNLMSTNQDSVENLQMRPAANSLLFKAASQNQKTPAMLPMSTPLSTNANTNQMKDTQISSNTQYPSLATPSSHLLNPSRPSSTPSSEYESKTNLSATIIEKGLKATSSHPNFSIYNAHTEETDKTEVESKKIAIDKNNIKPVTDQIVQTQQQGSVEKTNLNAASVAKQKKEKMFNKEEVLKKTSLYIKENFFYKDTDDNIETENIGEIEEKTCNKINTFAEGFLQLKVPEKCLKDVCIGLVMDVLDKSEEIYFDRVVEFFQILRKQSILKPNLVLEIFKQVTNKMNERETLNPRIASHVANLLSKVVGELGLLKLSDVANFTDNGQHFPLFFLILQQLHKSIGKEALEEMFQASKINLMNCLPEVDRKKSRLIEILDDRNLAFLCPLIKVQSEMLKQLTAESEPNASNFLKWIKSNVDSKYYKDPGFITALMTVILKYVTQESTLSPGVDVNNQPEKSIIEKEESLLYKYTSVLQKFLAGNTDLQVIAIYALQVFCHNEKFPKGMLRRWFAYLYDAEVIEEEAFILWKEEISDKYPGKGKALFQVNSWLTWLEIAESEDDED